MDNLDDELEKMGMTVGKFPFPWYYKLALKISPRLFMSLMARKQGMDDSFIDQAESLFRGKKIHISPMKGSPGRGFILVIDNNKTLWFDQDGDHFEYDGFEMGEYNDGDVTVLDGIENEEGSIFK